MFALSDWPALLFDFVEGPVGMFTGRGAMTFNTSFAEGAIRTGGSGDQRGG